MFKRNHICIHQYLAVDIMLYLLLTCNNLPGLVEARCADVRVHAATVVPKPIAVILLTAPASLAADVRLKLGPEVLVNL